MENGRPDAARSASGNPEVQTKLCSAVSAEERHRMIAEAAYFRAERREFQGGDSVQDWLAAEAEIDKLLEAPARQQDAQELAAYKRMRQELAKILADVGDTVNVETIRQAFDRAAKELKDVGGYATETVSRVSQRLRREVESTASKLGPRWEAFSEKRADLFSVWLGKSSTFVSHASGAVGEWLKQLQSKNGDQIHIAGEIVEPGTFVCTACRRHVKVEERQALPPCPTCQEKGFRRLRVR
jgi:Zn finger protein HypA/HybF involved in hydrogenase expression